MKSDGANQTRLTFEIGGTRLPVWSPNGRQIAFEVHWGMDIDLFVMDADGNNQRALTPHPEIDRSPHWHPDGKRIAFSRNIVRWEHDDEEIYTADIDGGEPQLVIKAADPEKMRMKGEKITQSVVLGLTGLLLFLLELSPLYPQLPNYTPLCASFEVFAPRVRDRGLATCDEILCL